MSCRRDVVRRGRTAVVLALLALLGPVGGVARAEGPPAGPPASGISEDPSYGLASILGSIIFAPVKLAIICPSLVLGSGFVLVGSGDPAKAGHVLRVGCGGTYLPTADMIRGEEAFDGSGGPAVIPAPMLRDGGQR